MRTHHWLTGCLLAGAAGFAMLSLTRGQEQSLRAPAPPAPTPLAAAPAPPPATPAPVVVPPLTTPPVSTPGSPPATPPAAAPEASTLSPLQQQFQASAQRGADWLYR